MSVCCCCWAHLQTAWPHIDMLVWLTRRWILWVKPNTLSRAALPLHPQALGPTGDTSLAPAVIAVHVKALDALEVRPYSTSISYNTTCLTFVEDTTCCYSHSPPALLRDVATPFPP